MEIPVTVVRKIVNVRNFYTHDPYGKKHSAWIIEYQQGEEQHAVGFPTELLACRSAEYGIDPADADTLLQVAMHEHMFRVPREHPKHLYNTDEETGRQHQLELLEASRNNYEYHDPDGLLEQIKQEHLLKHNPADHKARQAVVAELRARSMRENGIKG